MQTAASISQLPTVPAVYAMYGGHGRGAYVAYVGVGENLKRRVGQHLVRHSSSVTTGVAAVGLNVEHVTQVQWWEHPDFSESQVLVAAELVAFDVLDPALRSRGAVQEQAKWLYDDESFRERMHRLFTTEPSGCLVLPSLTDALERIADLDRRLAAVEAQLADAERQRR